MSIHIYEYGTAFGIEHMGAIFRWNGHSFNPTGNTASGYQTYNAYTFDPFTFAITLYNPTTSFNLSGFQYGNEVVLFGLKFANFFATTLHYNLHIYFTDPFGDIIWESSFNGLTLAPSSFTFFWQAIGIKASTSYGMKEIWMNGTYTAGFEIHNLNTGVSTTGANNFTVSNYPPVIFAGWDKIGSLWVEGANLAYIPNQGHKIVAKNDGTATYVGTAYSGAIWLEIDGKISYVDSSGYRRRTKMGDEYGVPTWDDTELPKLPGSSTKGSIWLSNWAFDTYLMIVSGNGRSYRIGAGFTEGGDHQ